MVGRGPSRFGVAIAAVIFATVGWPVLPSPLAGPVTPVPVRSLERGLSAPQETASRELIRTAARWEQVWRATHPGEGRPVPKIDFSREMVAAVFMGRRSTGGYAVAVMGSREEKGRLVVTVEERSPPPTAMLIQMLTSPYHFAAVKASRLPERWDVVRRQGGKP